MVKQTLRQTATIINTNNTTEFEPYLIKDKNLLLEILNRTDVVTIDGKTIKASVYAKDYVRRVSAGSSNIMQHLSKFHPLLWITHAFGNWSDECRIKNSVSTFSDLQDKWFIVCKNNGIYREGKGMSDYGWDEFKRNWTKLVNMATNEVMSPEDIINWLRVQKEDADKKKRQEEDAVRLEQERKIKAAQEEGARRVAKMEAEKKAAAEAEEARRERERRAKEEERRRKEEAEAREMAEEEEFNRMLEEEKASLEQKRIEDEKAAKAEETKRKRAENMAKARAIHIERSKERNKQKEKVKVQDDLFVENAVSPEVDSDLFVDSDAADFLVPQYRRPGASEVRLNSFDGRFLFGEMLSEKINDKKFKYMHIECVKGTFYFTFDNKSGVETINSGALVCVDRKVGVEQMIARLGFEGTECIFVKLSGNKSYLSNKLAFMVESTYDK